MGGSGNSSSEDDEDDDIRPPPPVRKLVRKPSPIKRPKIKRRKIKQSKPSYTWTPFDHDSDEDFQSKPPDIGLVANKSGPKQHTSRKNSNSSSSSSSSNKNNNNSGKLKSKASNSRSSSSSSRDLIDDSSSNDVIMRTEDEYSDSSNSKSSITRVLRKRFTDINVETDSSLSELESDDSNSTNTTNNKTHHRHFKQFAQTHSANKKEIFQPPESTSSTLLENNVSLKGKRAFKIPEIPKPRKKPSKTTSPAAAAATTTTTTTKTVSKICQHCQEPGHVDKYDKKCKLHKKKEGKSPFRGKWQRSSSDSSITTSADESSDSSSSSSSVGRGKSVKRCCINYGKDHKSRTSDKCLNCRPPIKTKLIKRYFHNYNVDCELKSVKMSFATICHNEEIRKQVYNDVREVSAFKVAFSYWFEFLLRHKNTPVLDDLKASDNEPDFYILYSQYLKERNLAKTCDAKVGKIFEEFQKLHPSDNDYKYNGHGKTNIMKQAIAQWTENFQQNVEKHAKDRLKKYFKSIKNKDHERRYDDKEIDDIVEKLLINNVIPEDDLFKNYTHLDFTNLRIKRKWWKFVGFFKEMQKFIKFKLSPICKHGLHHMLYDTSAVHQLLMRLPGKIVGSNYEIETVGAVAVDLQPDPEPYKFLKMWGLFVKIPSKHKNFGCSLSTDGVAVTIHCLRKMKETIEVDSDDELFDDEIEYEADDEDDDDDDDDDDGEKKKKEDKKDSTPDDGEITVRYMIQKIEERYDRLVGLDPGLKEIFAGIILELLRNYSNKEFQERFKLKSATYHHKTHHCQRDIKRRKWTQNYEKTFKQQLKQYRQENDQFKVDNPTDYENITRYRLQLFEAGQPDYSQKKVARLKLDKYINTQIVNEIIANYIVSGEYMSSKKELRLKRQKEKRKQEREERRKEKRERDKQRIFEKNQRKKERREEKKKKQSS